MTAQVPDSITVDGRRWVIEEWDGERDCIPANESLGFRTVSPATNNWRGRIDHFLIWHDRLLLFKVEVSLHPDDKGILPFGSPTTSANTSGPTRRCISSLRTSTSRSMPARLGNTSLALCWYRRPIRRITTR